jgi:peptide/nickel transport system substrate-binding protein
MAWALLASACTGHTSPTPSAATPSQRGGTLRVGVLLRNADGSPTPCEFTLCAGQHDDPQWAGEDPMTFEIERCCLARTLLSYNGEPTRAGGTVLRPDLAAALPTVSADGLTWTFRIKAGLRYAPPLQNVAITAADFVRSLERLLGPPPPDGPDYYGGVIDPYVGNYLTLRDLIAGASDYINGHATHVSGLEAPDPLTLRVHLTHPDGGLVSILSLPDAAPIAPNPFDPSARFGVLDRHDRLAFGYQVASGPYMIDGADKLTMRTAPQDRTPAAGDGGASLTLVRNPSWRSSTDPLRPALPDRIVLTPVATPNDALALLKSGALDLILNWDAGPSLVRPGGLGSGLRSVSGSSDTLAFLEMNAALPPLDDIHVRRAMNAATARGQMLPILDRAGVLATPATHIGLDSEEDNLLLNFDPYRGVTGDLTAAKEEMAASRYDANGDGVCDASACHGVRLLVNDSHPGEAGVARLIARQLAAIGVDIRVVVQDSGTFNSTFGQPRAHIPLRIADWIKDLTSGSTYFPPLFASPATGLSQGIGGSLLGATPELLRRWGYGVTSVPNVDARVEACLPLAFGAQTQCWARLDQYLMTDVVPWVPLVSATSVRLTSNQVAGVAFDQSPPTPMPALDRVALRPGRTPSPSPVPSFAFPAIPDGTYRATVTRADLYRFDPRFDPGSVDESTGTFTIWISGGRFRWVQDATHAVYGPQANGAYRGSGDQVTFVIQAPAGDELALPTERWHLDGDRLTFTLSSCRNLDRIDPTAPHLCEDTGSLLEAEPWVKIG